MAHVLTLSAPDGTHSVALHPEIQGWALDDCGATMPAEVRDRGRALLADVARTGKRVPRDAVWGWVRALRGAWRRAPRSFLQIWLRGADGHEEAGEAYLSDGTSSWMVEATPGQLSLTRLTPKVATERKRTRKPRWLSAEPAEVAAWAAQGSIPPEDFQRLCGDGPLRLEHATPGQHFAKELAGLESLVLHLEATGLPEVVCHRS